MRKSPYLFVKIQKSSKPQKKLEAIFINRKTGKKKSTHFGAKGYSDYTVHKDKERRDRYIKRHAKDLKTKDATRAGFLSMYILWGRYTNWRKNVSGYVKKFGLD